MSTQSEDIGRREAIGVIVATGAALTLGSRDPSARPNPGRTPTTIARLKSDPEAREAAAMMQTNRIILREERTFVELVDGTFNLLPRRS